MTQATTAPRPAETPTPRRRRHWVRWLVIGLVVVALAAAGIIVWLNSEASRQNTRAQVITRTVKAESSDQTVTVGLSGTLTPRKTAALNFSVAGTVTDVYVKVGDTVKKGQKLARVDDSDLQDALDLAEANLDTAEANLDDVEDDGSDAAVAAANAQVKSAKAAVSSAKDDLKNAVLKSTISGTVASLDLSEGDVLTSAGSGQGGNQGAASTSTTDSSQVLVIATAAWNLEGTVGSTDLSSLKTGQAVAVTPTGATEPLTGKVSSIGIVATSTSDGSATFPVVVSLDGEHPDLYSGTTAQGVVTVAQYPDVLTVPTAAISTSNGKSVVQKLVNGQAVTTEVGIGRVFGTSTEITSGLAAGDEVQLTIVRGGATSAEATGGSIFGGFGGRGGGVNGAPPDGAPRQGNGQSSGGAGTTGGGQQGSGSTGTGR